MARPLSSFSSTKTTIATESFKLVMEEEEEHILVHIVISVVAVVLVEMGILERDSFVLVSTHHEDHVANLSGGTRTGVADNELVG